jgi:hypothetical protein
LDHVIFSHYREQELGLNSCADTEKTIPAQAIERIAFIERASITMEADWDRIVENQCTQKWVLAHKWRVLHFVPKLSGAARWAMNSSIPNIAASMIQFLEESMWPYDWMWSLSALD